MTDNWNDYVEHEPTKTIDIFAAVKRLADENRYTPLLLTNSHPTPKAEDAWAIAVTVDGKVHARGNINWDEVVLALKQAIEYSAAPLEDVAGGAWGLMCSAASDPSNAVDGEDA